MPENERGDFNLAMQVAELRADVRHVQSDTTDIKAELRATNQRLDSLSQKTDERFERLEQKFDERFEKSDARVDERFDKIDGRFQKVDDRFERLEHKFEQLKESLASAKIWALGLYIALAGSLLYVLAHGFKWL
jgi:predicted nuclease with TOPRIM domain